jgi:hypothetical protein
MRRPPTSFEIGWMLFCALGGFLLRVWHLGTPSLWWDETIHLGTAWQDDAWRVFQQAKLGIPPGFGNAGAVPLDYLVLHAYLQLVPMPRPEHVEAYFRMPSCVASALTPPLVWLWARRHFGRGVALVAATLLALSIPHVLYAVEARSYSLIALMTVVHLVAFSRVVEAPSVGRWILFGVVSILYFLTGLLGLLVVAITYAVLAVLVAAPLVRGRLRWRAFGRDLVMWGAVGTAVGVAVYLYFLGTQLWAVSRRAAPASDPVGTTIGALSYYVMDSTLLLALLALSVPVMLWACWYGRRRYPPALVVTLLLLLIAVVPAIVGLEQRKRYYFHVRHALFLLPVIMVVVAATLDALLVRLDPLRILPASHATRRLATVGLELGLVLALCGPVAVRYLQRPNEFFARTKTLRDLRGLAQTLRVATATSAPDEKLLVLVERRGPGFLANPTLTLYLRWYGLGDRIVLRGAAIPASTVRQVADRCAAGCRGRDGPALQQSLQTTEALAVPFFARQLLRIEQPLGAWPGRARSVAVVSYSAIGLGPWAAPLERRALTGLTLWQPAADGPFGS